MNDTSEILEGQDNEAGQGATNVQEDKGKPHSHQKLVKKDLLFGVISLRLKGRRNLRQLVTTVAQLMLVIVS